MKRLKVSGKFRWIDLEDIVKKEDVILCFPEFFLGIKKNERFLKQLHQTIQQLDELELSHWITFFDNSDFSNQENEINYLYDFISDKEKDVSIVLNSDISMISLNLDTIDELYFLDKQFSDLKSEINFNDIILSNKHKIQNMDNWRYMPIDKIGKTAECFLKRKVYGRYHLDPAASPFTGIAFEYKNPQYNQFNYGYGRSFSFLNSKYIASLEAVERYASQFYTYNYKNSSIYTSFKKISKVAVSPKRFGLEKNSNIDDNSELFWTQVYSVAENKYVFIPEDLVFYGNEPTRKNYIRDINDSSNGVALGSTVSEALICSLMELIERHSFLSVWYGEMKGQKIVNFEKILSEDEKKALNIVTSEGACVELFEISTFKNIYVVWGLVRNASENSTMATYTSAGSGFTLEQAIRSAFMEVTIGYLVQKNYHKKFPRVPDEVLSIDDHIDFFGNPINQTEFDFVNSWEELDYQKVKSENISEFSNQEEILRDLIKNISKSYPMIYFANLTSNFMAKNNLYVTKAIVPGFLPMTFGEKNLRISLDMINKVRLENNQTALDSINYRPHPFP